MDGCRYFVCAAQRALAAALLIGSPAVQAQFGTEVCVQAHSVSRCMSDPHRSADTQTEVDDPAPGDHRLAIATAQSRAGQLAVTAYANGEGRFIQTQSRAEARFEDRLTIAAPVPPGTRGTFRARMRVDGSLHASGYNFAGGTNTGFASSTLGSRLSILADGFPSGQLMSGRRSTLGPPEGQEAGFLEALVQFTFGIPIQLVGELIVSADGRGGSQVGTAGLAHAVYGSSAYWSGIQEVRLLDTDEPVTEFTVTSESGVDYRVDFGFDPIFHTGFDS